MCTLAVAFGVSALFSAAGTYQQGQAQAKASEANARIAENNAQITKNKIQSVAVKEAQDKENLRRATAKKRAQGQVGYAAGGVVLGTGSALDWELELTEQEMIDQSTIEYNAQLEKNALGNTANAYTAQASINSAAASDAQTGALIGTGTSLLDSYVGYKLNF